MPVNTTVTPHDTVGVSDYLAKRWRIALPDPVGVTGYLGKRWHLALADSVGLPNTIDAPQVRVQYDTWRPAPRPDNKIVVACRTPAGEHDTATGFTHMTLWTFHNDGTNENVVLDTPATYGWSSYGHPEWSADGSEVVIWVETPTEYRLVRLDASSWERQ